jgi:hypothetical protein
MKTWVLVTATSKRTRVVATVGDVVALRANLPPLSTLRNARAVTTLLEGLSLWADDRLCVALCAENPESCFRFDLVDEMGLGARSVYYAVELVKREPRRQRRRAAEAGEVEQLPLVALQGGAR